MLWIELLGNPQILGNNNRICGDRLYPHSRMRITYMELYRQTLFTMRRYSAREYQLLLTEELPKMIISLCKSVPTKPIVVS